MTELVPPPGYRIRTGCDIVAVAEVEQSIARFGDRYLRRVFTPGELSYSDGPDRAARLAARFAAKEAVIKAFAEPSAAFGFFDVEVETVGSVPRLVFRGTAARLAAEQGWVSSSVSLTHAPCHAAAMVAASCVESPRSTNG
ncbi:holo-[acyl-carrier-protein] synthase [Mycobacterium antarcticum]|uniref:holo-ACP synthase n=1 Tax=unclassified Mycolicibacterium TaxID=2636767 RepID=UPI002395B1CE|nr:MULTISPECIES: 4'-phosphopantetheinyl transferase superfamily protein [unclassified Mycolicibacterium]GLP77701.1 holo-[acyl-carrier-protein] synthase [Mycolicibacterium sp. TUM20983]GLP81899.1 holo-[acyl-carrier-protein] synthase [Mycolicibacterium sp. TUM20984]